MTHSYPPIKPFHTEMLDVGSGHSLYLEQTGNPDGIPVLYLHGGPGAGQSPIYRSLFDPDKYHIIGFDQRGCGQSTPHVSLRNNTTQALLEDIQLVRQHLGISKWLVCGGSWGATLALLTAIDFPSAVTGLILRGVFLGRSEDIDWFISPHGGAAQVFPDHYERLLSHIPPPKDTQDILNAYHDIFDQGDELTRASAAKAWCLWEEKISCLASSVNEQDLTHILHQATSLAILECHYMRNHCFIEENFILDNIQRISHIPGTIVQGRYDMICKMKAAFTLSQHWPNGQLLVVPEAGHSVSEPAISEALCHASDAMAKFIQEDST